MPIVLWQCKLRVLERSCEIASTGKLLPRGHAVVLKPVDGELAKIHRLVDVAIALNPLLRDEIG